MEELLKFKDARIEALHKEIERLKKEIETLKNK